MFDCLPVSHGIVLILGVRSLANASRARQFNPLNPPGVGWVPLPQTNMAAVRGRVRAWSVMRGRVRSCARSCVRGRSFVVVRGRSCRSARFAASTAVARTNEQHLISNNPLNPPGVGGSIFFILLR